MARRARRLIGRGVRTGACLAVLLLALAGCATGGSPAGATPSASATPTYRLPPRPVRPSETALALPPTRVGDTEFTLIGLSAMDTLLGSHAEWPATGHFVRVRLVVVNTGRSGTRFDTKRQQLVTADGVAHDPDSQAMLIKRQPDVFDLGANVRVEFDLYWDVPKDARPVALRAHGGPTLTDLRDEKGTDLPLG